MYNATDFLSAFRHFLPSGEHFLFETLMAENLSTEARDSLFCIQNTLSSILYESSSFQVIPAKVEFYYKSSFKNSPDMPCLPTGTLGDLFPVPDPLDTPISPPKQFREEIQSADEIESEFQHPQSEPSSQIIDFKLTFDSTNDNSPMNSETTTTTTTTTTATELELHSASPNTEFPAPPNFEDATSLKPLSSINNSKKRPTTEEFISKKIKLTSPDSPVLISDGDTDAPSDVISPDSLAEYDASCFDFAEECVSPRQNGACSKSAASSSSSSSSSYTCSSMSSSSSTPERDSPEKENKFSDVIDLHVAPDEAFSSSENNTPEAEGETQPQVAQVAQGKLPVKSRLGTRVASQDDTIECVPPPLNLKKHSEIVLQCYSEKPIKCNDCHSALPPVTSELLKCKHCFSKYKQKEFERHMTPQRDTPICPFCKVTFKTECEMNIHKNAKHPKIVLCDSCLASRRAKKVPGVGSSSNYSSSSPKHSVDGSYKCQDCSMRFKTTGELNTHKKVSHSPLTSSPLVPELHQVSLPERVPSLPTPRVQRTAGQELDPNCDLQLSKNDATREFEFVKNKQIC